MFNTQNTTKALGIIKNAGKNTEAGSMFSKLHFFHSC